MNQFDKESLEDQDKRDVLFLIELSAIYNVIRDKVHKIAGNLADKTEDNPNYLTERAGRKQVFAKTLNDELRPEYIKRDKFLQDRYAEEYRTSYFYSKYSAENQAISKGYKVKLPRYTKKQFQTALNNPLSKLMDTALMQTGRNVDIQQLYTTIISGVEEGLSLPKINRELDVKLGYRKPNGDWIFNPDLTKEENLKLRKGQQAKTRTILRTEIGRIREDARYDQWLQQQEVVQSLRQLFETLDSRTRSQSASMDGQVSNEKGEFKYPDGEYYRFKHSKARWDINDRGTTADYNPEYPPETRIARDPDRKDPKTGKIIRGKNKIVPYQNFETWAKDQKPPLRRNKFGEWLFK